MIGWGSTPEDEVQESLDWRVGFRTTAWGSTSRTHLQLLALDIHVDAGSAFGSELRFLPCFCRQFGEELQPCPCSLPWVLPQEESSPELCHGCCLQWWVQVMFHFQLLWFALGWAQGLSSVMVPGQSRAQRGGCDGWLPPAQQPCWGWQSVSLASSPGSELHCCLKPSSSLCLACAAFIY